MAKIEFIQEAEEDKHPASVECIEVRIWGAGGKSHQQFVIGSGANFDGSSTLLLEIVYTVGGVQFFYTRNYLHLMDDIGESPYMGVHFDMFQRGEVDDCWFCGMLPETAIHLKREKYTRTENGQQITSASYHLEISADVGAVVGHAPPGERAIEIKLPYIPLERGLQFVRDVAREIEDTTLGKRPNPAELPEGASDWFFIRQLNQKAYDLISEDYQEKYFSNPQLTGMFDAWLAELPTSGHILDAGCGHGDPVITRLLEKGFQVTGTDLSPRMLSRASGRFPGVRFVNQMVSDIRSEAEYDGACSLSSLLYLDPIDLSHSLYRLYHALKPGGLLFLFAHDLHPSWRGQPYSVDINQWMWTWTYGMEDAVQALEEFGYFKVLKVEDVSTAEEKAERIERWRKYTQEDYEKLIKSLPKGASFPAPDLTKVPTDLAYTYALIARREP